MTSNMDNIRKHPIYQEALKAFSNGDDKKGRELISKLHKDPEITKNIDEHMDKNQGNIDKTCKDAGIILIKKDQEMPEGYTRNSYSNHTCISTQQKDLPEWKEIVARVEYEGKAVYEDHYMFNLTSENIIYQTRQEHTQPFTCIIKSFDMPVNILNKLKKNMLHMAIDKLCICLKNVHYSVIELLLFFVNHKTHEYLKEVIVEHFDREYDLNEIKNLKLLFKKTKWERLQLVGKFELIK